MGLMVKKETKVFMDLWDLLVKRETRVFKELLDSMDKEEKKGQMQGLDVRDLLVKKEPLAPRVYPAPQVGVEQNIVF